jgi:competence protein ComGC
MNENDRTNVPPIAHHRGAGQFYPASRANYYGQGRGKRIRVKESVISELPVVIPITGAANLSHSRIMKQTKKAFTLVELLVVIGTIAVLGAMLLPAFASTKGNSQKITCLNNLKQVGLAFRVWEGNHGSRYPMQVAAVSGGANDYLSHNSGTATPNAPCCGYTLVPGIAFIVMSNELSTPKVLFCPSDNIHTANSGYATNFSYQDLLDLPAPAAGAKVAGPQPGEKNAGEGSKISYFVNGDATEANPQDVMTGDDNIGNNGAVTASATANYRFGASASANTCSQANFTTTVGITSTAFNGNPYWSWTANDFHRKAGNLGFADGSCQSVTITGLHFYLNNSTNGGAEAINFMP